MLKHASTVTCDQDFNRMDDKELPGKTFRQRDDKFKHMLHGLQPHSDRLQPYLRWPPTDFNCLHCQDSEQRTAVHICILKKMPEEFLSCDTLNTL